MPFRLQYESKDGLVSFADVYLERHSNLPNLDESIKTRLSSEFDSLLKSCWGAFPKDFIERHIFSANDMIIARIAGVCVGVCIMSIKNIFRLKVNYIEFLLVDRKYQKSGLGSHLSFVMIRREIIRNAIPMFLGKPLEIFFITPNIRVLSRMAKFASFIYPNPYLANESGTIQAADDETWAMAAEILRQSDNPSRVLDRQGLVLHGSYANTPWLVYNNDTAPWHSSERINTFAKKYLGYYNGEDKEFIVRAHVSLSSLFRYLLHCL